MTHLITQKVGGFRYAYAGSAVASTSVEALRSLLGKVPVVSSPDDLEKFKTALMLQKGEVAAAKIIAAQKRVQDEASLLKENGKDCADHDRVVDKCQEIMMVFALYCNKDLFEKASKGKGKGHKTQASSSKKEIEKHLELLDSKKSWKLPAFLVLPAYKSEEKQPSVSQPRRGRGVANSQ